MKSEGMPTNNNNSKIESYVDYEKRTTNAIIADVERVINTIYNSSLLPKDKVSLSLAIYGKLTMEIAEILKANQ